MVLQMEPINIQVNSSLYYKFLLSTSSFPVYSVFSSSLLSFTMEKILASELLSTYSVAETSHFDELANAHRVFVTKDVSSPVSPVLSPSFHTNITGVVSIVDSAFLFLVSNMKNGPPILTLPFWWTVLSLFARVAKIPNIDPTRMQRHRSASSASSHSSISDRDFFHRSRSNSRTSVRQSPNIIASSPPGLSALERNSVPGIVLEPGLGSQRKEKRRSMNPKKESG